MAGPLETGIWQLWDMHHFDLGLHGALLCHCPFLLSNSVFSGPQQLWFVVMLIPISGAVLAVSLHIVRFPGFLSLN